MTSCSSSGDDPDSANAIDLYGTWEVQLLGRTYFMAIDSDMNGYTYTITNDYRVPNMMSTNCTYNKDIGTINISIAEENGIINMSSDILYKSKDNFSINYNGNTLDFRRKEIKSFPIKGRWCSDTHSDGTELMYEEYNDLGIGESYCIYNGKEENRKPISYTLDYKNMILKTTYKDDYETVVDVWHLYDYNGNSCEIQTREDNHKYIKVQ